MLLSLAAKVSQSLRASGTDHFGPLIPVIRRVTARDSGFFSRDLPRIGTEKKLGKNGPITGRITRVDTVRRLHSGNPVRYSADYSGSRTILAETL